MNEKEAIEYVNNKYDLDLLYDAIRRTEKNPSSFNIDNDKEQLDYEDLVEALVYKAMQND